MSHDFRWIGQHDRQDLLQQGPDRIKAPPSIRELDSLKKCGIHLATGRLATQYSRVRDWKRAEAGG
jgi:hypothetical protein